MLDARQRSLRYYNNNGLVEDPMSEWKDRKLINIWTPEEKRIFKERYLQHPKNFPAIASYLEKKVPEYNKLKMFVLHNYKLLCAAFNSRGE